MESDDEFPWFVGFFKGEGYATYGRIAVDTITPEFASKLMRILSGLSKKEVKTEVYGDISKFVLNAHLTHPRKTLNASDSIKLKADSVIDCECIQQKITTFLESINTASPDAKRKFLQGFFDAEATVSPAGTIEVDLSKKNE